MKKGEKITEELRLKMRLAKLGKRYSQEFKDKLSYAHSEGRCKCNHVGKIHSPESIAKRVAKMIGRPSKLKGIPRTQEVKDKIGNANRGRKKPGITGENHYLYKGTTPVYEQIRKCLEYKIWRNGVFFKDSHSCVLCGDSTSGNLNADHYPVPFSAILNKLIVEQGLENLYEKALKYDLFWSLDNGRTLCIPCHENTDTYGNKANKFKFEEIKQNE